MDATDDSLSTTATSSTNAGQATSEEDSGCVESGGDGSDGNMMMNPSGSGRGTVGNGRQRRRPGEGPPDPGMHHPPMGHGRGIRNRDAEELPPGSRNNTMFMFLPRNERDSMAILSPEEKARPENAEFMQRVRKLRSWNSRMVAAYREEIPNPATMSAEELVSRSEHIGADDQWAPPVYAFLDRNFDEPYPPWIEHEDLPPQDEEEYDPSRFEDADEDNQEDFN